MSLIIAACALFTAVYDVIQRLNSSNTVILSATSGDAFGVDGVQWNGNESYTLKFAKGTYLVFFNGQQGGGTGWADGHGAACIAFYKSPEDVTDTDSMTVQLAVGGGKGGSSNGSDNGGGKTKVTTNFALPAGYSGELTAIAAGAGGGDTSAIIRRLPNTWMLVVDGTFKGWDGSRESLGPRMGLETQLGGQQGPYVGAPACQTNNGQRAGDALYSPNAYVEYGGTGGGGAGYFDGGGGASGPGVGGGGSCTPWCYPISCSDIENGPVYSSDSVHAGMKMRYYYDSDGSVMFYRIDPTSLPSASDDGKTLKNTGEKGAYTPETAVKAVLDLYTTQLDPWSCGIETAWVYSVSENGGVS